MLSNDSNLLGSLKQFPCGDLSNSFDLRGYILEFVARTVKPELNNHPFRESLSEQIVSLLFPLVFSKVRP
jgi:hypothetical protein